MIYIGNLSLYVYRWYRGFKIIFGALQTLRVLSTEACPAMGYKGHMRMMIWNRGGRAYPTPEYALDE